MTDILQMKNDGKAFYPKSHFKAIKGTEHLLTLYDMPVIAQTKYAVIQEPDSRTIKTGAHLPFGDIDNEGIIGTVSANDDIPFQVKDGKIYIKRDCALYITVHFQEQHVSGSFYFYCNCYVTREGKDVQIERFAGIGGKNLNWRNDVNGSIARNFKKGDVIWARLETNTTDFVNIGLGRCRIFQIYPITNKEILGRN
ncbi:hypothetical protein [Enterococcus faecium]|uniref:hypothetical protein n=1 Tax=Enterococcus faecium TaxID=1352 RepID=UPI000BF07875|nr:hypothetical protein [Enterococcus faecium]PEH49570.1 hypothetical protein CRM75_01280 [Enterococcus faecium]